MSDPEAVRVSVLEALRYAHANVYRALRVLSCARCTGRIAIGALHTRLPNPQGRVPELNPHCAVCQPLDSPLPPNSIPPSAPILLYVDYSGRPQGPYAWGALLMDLSSGEQWHGSGSLCVGSESAAVEEARLWLEAVHPGRGEVTIFNDAYGQHQKLIEQGVDVRYMPRTDGRIGQAHSLARGQFQAALRELEATESQTREGPVTKVSGTP